jgi:hypothetical protein
VHLAGKLASPQLMQIYTVPSPEMPGFVELGISPHSVEAILQKMLSNRG